MKKTSEVQETVTKIDKVICDVCGKEIEKNELNEFYDYFEIDKKWGYFSKCDGRNDKFDICEDCYEKMLNLIGLRKRAE